MDRDLLWLAATRTNSCGQRDFFGGVEYYSHIPANYKNGVLDFRIKKNVFLKNPLAFFGSLILDPESVPEKSNIKNPMPLCSP